MYNKWILQEKNNLESNYRLFCIPYAGAGASIYRGWQTNVDHIEVMPIQIPGRENRISETFVVDMEELVDKIYDGIKEYLNKPYSLFGHSMGGMIAYELFLKIKKERDLLPQILFMSGSSLEKRIDDETVSNMSDERLKKYLLNMGGTDEALLNYECFRETYFPIIKADFKLIENYYSTKERVDCKLRGFTSYNDTEISYKDVEKLKAYAEDFKVTYFEGNHFFINSNKLNVCKTVQAEIDYDNYLIRV